MKWRRLWVRGILLVLPCITWNKCLIWSMDMVFSNTLILYIVWHMITRGNTGFIIITILSFLFNIIYLVIKIKFKILFFWWNHSTIEFAQMGIFLSKKLGKYQSKWTLGIPFYGRNIKTGEAKAFYELIPDLSDNRTDTVNEVYYNSQETIVSKIIMARIAKIGGIMIWELGQDIRPYISISDGESSQTSLNENSLMNAIYKGIRIDLDSLLSSNSKDL